MVTRSFCNTRFVSKVLSNMATGKGFERLREFYRSLGGVLRGAGLVFAVAGALGFWVTSEQFPIPHDLTETLDSTALFDSAATLTLLLTLFGVGTYVAGRAIKSAVTEIDNVVPDLRSL